MTKFGHVNIITDDWGQLAKFYVDVFGCRPLPPERDLSGPWLDKATGIGSARLRGIHLALPGFEGNSPTLEIFQYEANRGDEKPVANRRGFGHIAFQVDDVRETLSLVLQHGGGQVGDVVETVISGAGVITFVYATDPDGNIIELQRWTRAE